MSVLLDTNVVSELRKRERADPWVRRWFEGVPEADVYLSVLVLGEIRRGIERIRAKDPRQAATLANWMRRLAEQHGGRILSVDRRVADAWGRFCAIRLVSPIDLLMAATASVHDLTLATRNVRHVAWTGVRCVNPFTSTSPAPDDLPDAGNHR